MTAISWKNFIESTLRERSPLGICIQCENTDPIPMSALTLVNRKIVDLLVGRGVTKIAIGVCDYSREALALTLGMAIDDALRGHNQIAHKVSNWKRGDIVALCGYSSEFVDFSEVNDFGSVITYVNQKDNAIIKQGLSFVPGRIQRCKEGTKPTSRRIGTLRDGVNVYNNLPEKAKVLHDCISLVDRPAMISTSQSPFSNVPPTKFKNAKVSIGEDELLIQKCMKLGYIGSDGVLKEYCEYNYEGNPSVIAICRDEEGSGDLYRALEYIENGGRPSAVVVEVPEPEVIDGMFGDIEDIAAHGVPILVFCDERTLKESKAFNQLGFSTIYWTREALRDLEELSTCCGYSLSRRESYYAHQVVRIEPVVNSGIFPSVAEAIYKISSNRRSMSSKGQQAYSSISRLLSTALKQTEVIPEDVSSRWTAQIDRATDVLCDSAFDSSLTSSEVKELQSASELLHDALSANNPLPKEDVAYRALKHSLTRGRNVCLVTSNTISARESSEYWRGVFSSEGLNSSQIKALTPREFLKLECVSDEEDVFISGWFNRETMDKLINSALSRVYSIFLYRGERIKLETNWYMSALDVWMRRRNILVAKTRKTFECIGLCEFEGLFSESSPTSSSKTRKDFDDSISGLVEEIDNERSLREQASKGEEASLARPVYFTNGKHRWLRVPEAVARRGGDTLIVVEGLFVGNPEYIRKSAYAIHSGDVVLKADADEDALDDLCKSNFGSYEETLRIAQSWREPIDEARRFMSDVAIKDRIIKAGSEKTDQTIMSWIRGDVAIAPNSRKDIAVISRAFNDAISDEEIEKIVKAVKIARGDRIKTGKNISETIAECFISDVVQYGVEEAVTGFPDRHGLGIIELLGVDHVGKPQRVSISRLGFYLD